MIIILLGLVGLVLGSFTNALVWRVYMQGERLAKNKTQKTKSNSSSDKYSVLRGRSMCPHCEHTLAAKDLVPVFSWITLKGRCRYCRHAVSWQYPMVEIFGLVLVVVSYIFWPYTFTSIGNYVSFMMWILILFNGLALTVYDLKWMILPNRLVYSLFTLVTVFTITQATMHDNTVLLHGIIGSLAYGGFFYMIYQISGGKWIGGGDVRLGFILGVLLGWQKSILGLTLAAYLGTFVILILFFMGKYHKKMKLPFGPFLLTAAFLTQLWGRQVIDWYLKISGI